MGFFRKIMDKLGFDAGAGKVEEMLRTPAAPAAAKPAAPAAAPAQPNTSVAGAGAAPAAAPTATAAGTTTAAAPQPVQQVDVAAQLEQKAAASGQKLNWRTSIVDLLKLLDIDSSLAARKELATELGCPPALMEDSAKMNVWLHKAVMAKLAANGGKVPKELLD